MQQRDRRDALKLLAGGAAVAGATLIQTSTAFADGGTTSVRPPCTNNAAVVIWLTASGSHTVSINITDAPLNVDPKPTCPAGWSLSTQVAFLVNNGHEVRTLGGTVLASVGGTFGAFVDMPGNSLPVVMTGDGGGPIVDGDDARLDVMIRRVCTRISNPTKKAWCCAAFKYTGTYTYGTPDTWGGDFNASTGNGKLDQTVADGCTAP